MYPTPEMKHLHNLQGQFFGTQFFIPSLNLTSVVKFLISSGTKFQILFPKNLNEFYSYWTVFMIGCSKLDIDLSLGPL